MFVMRLIGIGLNGLQIFCSLMNLCSKFDPITYYKSLKNSEIAAQTVAESALKKRGTEEKEKTKYAFYIGDGNWKTFANLTEAKPYGNNFVVQKLECVLHVGKRMFRALKEVNKTLTELTKLKRHEEKKLKDKEPEKNKPIEKMPKSKTPVIKTTVLTGKVMKKCRHSMD